ncbi:TonB-dependent receptor [Pseudohaliea sp.]|uniref:TonB-dependent receptor n=1 Tax=Pseudohaliea sp. TaxID=2740289 RepID=UPI0032EF0995
MYSRIVRTLIVGPVLLGAAHGARSQEADNAAGTVRVLEEVVVSATRRERDVQDVSLSVTALSGDMVRDFGFENGVQVSDMVPNFAVQQQWGPGSPPYMSIRGVSYADFEFVNEMSVGTYIDEVFQAHMGTVGNQLFDLERVEVLRGPQGTLFGRNTTGGLVHYLSRKPTEETEGYLEAQVGSFDQRIVEGALGGALSDRLRARVAFKHNEDDGIRSNWGVDGSRFGKTDAQSVRAIIQYDATPDLRFEANVHASDADSTFAGYAFFGNLDLETGATCSAADVLNSRCGNEVGFVDPSPSAEHVYSRHDEFANEADGLGGYLKVDWSTAWGDFTSITAYEEVDMFLQQDFTGTHVAAQFWDTLYLSEVEQLSQEFRLEGSTDRLDWLLGAYYYTDERWAFTEVFLNDFSLQNADKTVETESFALFGHGEYALSEEWTLAAGVRVTDETRELTEFKTNNFFGSFDFSQPQIDVSSTEVTGRAALEWRPREATMYYLQYSRGFKSGGFNTSSSITDPALIGPVDPEVVDAFELGTKATLLGGRLRLNGSIFYMDFEGLQANAGERDPDSGTPVIRFLNLGQADIYGAELELMAVAGNWEFSLGGGLLDSEISTADTITVNGVSIDGNELSTAPASNFNGAIRYRLPAGQVGELVFQADGRYQSSMFFGPDNSAYEEQDAYGVFNLRVGWTSTGGDLTAQLFVENAGDEDYATTMFQAAGFPVSYHALGAPRRVGFRLGLEF